MLDIIFSLPDWILLPLFDLLSKKLINKVYQKAKLTRPYKELLNKNNVNLDKIKNLEDLKRLPKIDKKTFISKYELEDLLLLPLPSHYTVERSSGYSGKPNYWPRYKGQDDDTEKSLKFALNYLFKTKERTTIIFNTFALGTWVAGVKISKLLLNIADNEGSNITVVNVGVNNKECLEMWMALYKHYDQSLIMGYNPVVKDLLEMAQAKGLPFDKHRVNLLIGGEGFSEAWRDYVAEILNLNIEDYDQKIVSGYAAADTGVDLGFDYPLCTFTRRLITKYPELGDKIFGKRESEIPLFFQFVPTRVFIEEVDGELLFTSNNSVPLIRYNLHDRGGVISYKKLTQLLSEYPEYAEFIKDRKILPLPVVYLWGRTDGTVALLGAKIYLEHIKSAVLQKNLYKLLTGKFYANTEYTSDMEQKFSIVLEVYSIEEAEKNQAEIIKSIVSFLRKNCSEYANAYQGNSKVATPVLTFVTKKDFDEKYSNGIKVVYS